MNLSRYADMTREVKILLDYLLFKKKKCKNQNERTEGKAGMIRFFIWYISLVWYNFSQ